MTAGTMTETEPVPAWQRDKRWSDRYLPALKRICGEHLIGEAPEEEDRLRNTDLVVLRMEPVRIACRVRRYGYMDRYGGDFTIRAARPGGARTELAKILAGWGDYLLYAFAAPEGPELEAWVLADLAVFQRWHASETERLGAPPGEANYNADGSAGFYAYRWNDLPGEFIVASGCRDAARN